MTFEVLRVLKENGAAVHCIVNSWENHRIVELAESIGASWSTGRYWQTLDRHTKNPVQLARMAWDIGLTSAGLLRDAVRFRPTHIFLPEHVSLLRNAPALLALQAMGLPVIVRHANRPEIGRFYERLWGHVLPPLATRFIHISDFSRNRAAGYGFPERKMSVVKNRVPRRPDLPMELDAEVAEWIGSRKTLIVLGQIAPFKGTHFAVDAALALLEEGWDVQLAIVGRAPVWPPDYVDYYDGMVSRVAESPHRDRIRFLGETKSVAAMLRLGYLLLAPIPEDETFGTALLEARHEGLPVVAFPRGGIPEQVEHGRTGYLCRDCSLDALLEGVRHYLKHPEDRARASRQSLAGWSNPDFVFSPQRFESDWLRIFSMEAGSAPARLSDESVVAPHRTKS